MYEHIKRGTEVKWGNIFNCIIHLGGEQTPLYEPSEFE